MYKLLRTLLFLFPTEEVHYFSMNVLKGLCRWRWSRRWVIWACRPETSPTLHREVLGLTFRNPVGLGAGFDKNARYLRELDALGFGFVEVGTVTPLAQTGNDKPRLFRLPQDQALINRMGFNNEGVQAVAQRLKQWKDMPAQQARPLIVGGNIGKNKQTPNEEAWKDYVICFRELFAYVDYFVVNVSSPNTPGLRELQEKDALQGILTRLQALNLELAAAHRIAPRPLLLKIAPDLSWQQIDDVVELAMDIRLDGLVATNTTISRAQLITPSARLEAIGAGFTDTAGSSVLWSPGLRLLVAGDVAYNDIHPYLAETTTQSRAEWAATADRLRELNPAAVVAGHRNPDRPDDPAILVETATYLRDFNECEAATTTAEQLYSAMLERYPRRRTAVPLRISAGNVRY